MAYDESLNGTMMTLLRLVMILCVLDYDIFKIVGILNGMNRI